MDFTSILFHILSCLGISIFLGGAVLLFVQSHNGSTHPRARRALAFNLLMWSLAYLPSCFDLTLPLTDLTPMSVFTLITGNLYIIFSLLYPLELSRPGWITARRVTLLTLPYVCVVAVYFGVLAILGQPVRQLSGVPELLSRFGEFNVWFRFILYLCVCFYLAYLFISTSIPILDSPYDPVNRPTERRIVLWLRIYGLGMTCIAAVYLGVLLYGNLPSRFIHRLVTIVFFAIVIYMAGFDRKMNMRTETADGR